MSEVEKLAEEYSNELIRKRWIHAYTTKVVDGEALAYPYKHAYLAGYSAANRWIDFSEKKPEEGQPILVTNDKDMMPSMRFGVYRNNLIEYAWADSGDTASVFSHWLALPELPPEPSKDAK